MTPNPLLLFPLGALALTILYPIFDRSTDKLVSNSWRSRARRRILLGRTTVVVMLLAAAASEFWPLWPDRYVGKAAQALLICAVVLLPLLVAHVVVTWRSGRNSASETALREEGTVAAATARSELSEEAIYKGGRHDGRTSGAEAVLDTPTPDTPTPEPSTPEPSTPEPSTLKPSTSEPSTSEPSTSEPPAPDAREIETVMSSALAAPGDEASDHVGLPIPGSVSDTAPAIADGEEPSVGAQLERLDGLVDSFDLDERDDAYDLDERAEEGAPARVADSRSIATRTPVHDPDAPPLTAHQLARMSDGEIVSLVNTLHGDRVRLQKLVIAQQAAREAERSAHERTRTLARDAVRVMRSARESQKLAEKIARRERRERLKIEEKYDRVARALDNAISMVGGGPNARPEDVATSNGAGARAADERTDERMDRRRPTRHAVPAEPRPERPA